VDRIVEQQLRTIERLRGTERDSVLRAKLKSKGLAS
jgi:hypothetical protein